MKSKAQNISIIYEDESVVVINKPAGLVVHADGRTEEKTLVDWIMEKYPEAKEVGEPITTASGQTIYRPGIVHRLDRDTSGVMIVAKNNDAFRFLKSQFQNRETKKIYRAFVYGVVTDNDGIIDRPIARSRKDFRLWSAQRGARGETRDAVTHFKVLERGNDATYIEAVPKTGRTHQIRVHFKAINHPVVCDPLYAPKKETILGFERLALHSYQLTITLPNDEEKTFVAPLPKDFIGAEKLLKA